jgi:feruloyl esterase
MKKLFISMALALCCACAQAAGIESLKSLDLGQFEITNIREGASSSGTGSNKPTAVQAATPLVCVEVCAKRDSGSRVKMNIALPAREKWNKIYLAKGNGGLGNKTSAAAACSEAVLGYAASHNDLGTDGWQNSPDLKSVVADFGHRAIYNTARVSKQVIAAYYGEAPKYCYYSGGSTGGQEGLSLAERHPELFDGIAVLYPVTNRTRLHTRFAYERKVLAAKDYFTDQQIEAISAALVAQNRGNPGEYPAADYPFLKHPEHATCDYSQLTFLTAEQLDVLKKIHDTVKNAKGEYVTVGLVPSAELADKGKSLRKGYTGDWIYPMALGAAYRVAEVNFDADLRTVEDLFAKDCNALPNLEPFRKLGHRLIIIQGKLDTVVPAQYVKEYYDTVASRNGGIENTRRFARIFFVPGMWHGNMTHCNPLADLRKWVEQGVAPQCIEIGVRYKGKIYEQQVGVY